MSAARPFGDSITATIMVIGHDPRLQRSQAEAEFAFFMDYLIHPYPTQAGERRKYDLAQAVVSYMGELAGQPVALDELYVTNLCNEFLPPAPKRHTVLIPDEHAQRGVEAIVKAVQQSHVKIVLVMAPQPFYHLCRLGFIHDEPEVVGRFILQARPEPRKAAIGAYVPAGEAPFLAVCGCRFHHCSVPVVPILHVKQWPYLPTLPSLVRYKPLMANAERGVRAIMGLAVKEEHG